MSLYFPTSDEQSQHTIFPGVTIYTCSAEKMMLSYVELAPFAEVKEHSHPHEQVGMLLEGSALFFIGDEQKMLRKGDRWLIPGGVKHRVIAQAEGAKALDIFTPIREDYR
jgi:quercetin dioxygenase-like cupin family protein